MLEQYEINPSTMAIIPISQLVSKVVEEEGVYLVKKTPTEIIEDSCSFFGSSYAGRLEGTKTLLGISYKAPIIIEESMELIFFPTSSPRFDACYWISIAHLKQYKRQDLGSMIEFQNGETLLLHLSYGSLQNQVLRATRLQVVLRSRKLVK